MAKQEWNSGSLLRLLDHLSGNRESAWLQYSALKQKLTMSFNAWGHRSDARELADVVLDRIARKENWEEIRDIEKYAFGVAQKVRKENSRRHQKFVAITKDLPSNGSPQTALITSIELDQKRKCLYQCMQVWTHDKYELFCEYYLADDCDLQKHRKDLAERLGISSGALAARAARLRKKLQSCCMSCYEKRHLECLYPCPMSTHF